MVPFGNPSWLTLVPDPLLNERHRNTSNFKRSRDRRTAVNIDLLSLAICTVWPNAYVCFLLDYYTFFVFIWHPIRGFTQQQRRDYDKITFESLKIRSLTLQRCLCLQTFQNGWFNLAQCVFIVRFPCGVLSFIRFIRFILNCFFE